MVDSEGAPRAGQHFLFLNPEKSPNFSAARLFLQCLRQGFRTIAFTQSRKVTELIHVWVSQLAPDLQGRISSYRAGFMPEERRRIERRLARGDLLGVISTSALEMGIDIGYLDVCLLVGYPGTIINTWQRGGRVGRSGRESLVILVAKPDALDQYFMRHPEDFFGRGFEAALLDPDNPHVVEAHLPCAAAERPLTGLDRAFWPEAWPEHLEALERAGALSRTVEGEPTWFAVQRNPHLVVDIRSTGESYTIFDKESGEAIGTVDGIRAFKECHPGAVYLHRARQYLVDRLVLEKKDIVAHRTGRRYFTRARSEKETEILRTLRSKPEGQFLVREGDLKVTERVTGYEKRALPGQELMGVFPLDLPPQTFETIGFWVEIEPALQKFVERQGLHFMGGIHAVEHAAIGIFPLFALCDRNDIGGICYPLHPQLGKSAIFIYDGYPGGVGLAQRGFEIVGTSAGKNARPCGRVRLRGGLPLLHPLAQVRFRQQAAGQEGGGHGPGGPDRADSPEPDGGGGRRGGCPARAGAGPGRARGPSRGSCSWTWRPRRSPRRWAAGVTATSCGFRWRWCTTAASRATGSTRKGAFRISSRTWRGRT